MMASPELYRPTLRIENNKFNFQKIQKNPKKWTIITSDRELAGRAKNLGAEIYSSEEFIQKLRKNRVKNLNESKKQNPNLSKNEIKNWLDLFNNPKKE